MTPLLRPFAPRAGAALPPGGRRLALPVVLLLACTLLAPAQARIEALPQPAIQPSQGGGDFTPPAVQPAAPLIEPSGSSSVPRIQPSGQPQAEPLRLPQPEDEATLAQLRRLRATALAPARKGSAAEKAAARSAWVLGLLYLHGERVPLDRTQARYWFERARALGEPYASAGLAWCEINGCVGPPQPAAARPWIAQLRAVDAPLALLLEWWAQERLAPLPPSAAAPRAPDAPPQENGHAALLQRAAQAGSAQALNELGLRQIAAARLPDALAQFRAAAPRSPAAASNARLLASRMEQTISAQPAPHTADEWLAQARRYHRGDGVPSNYTEAIRLYQIAAASGSRPAKRMLELIYSRPAPDGTIDVAWMRQLSTMELSPEGSVLTLQPPPTPQLFVRDPTPLYALIPQEWRSGRPVGPR